MPPKKRRQLAGSTNYRKRKGMVARDQESMTTERDAAVSGNRTGVGGGGLAICQSGVGGASMSGEARVEGGMVSGEATVAG